MPHEDRSRPEIAAPYHRLPHLRPEWARWFRPLLTAGAAGVAQVVFAYLVLIGVVTVLAIVPGVDPLAIGRSQGDPASPLSVFVALALGAFTLPAALLGVRVGGWRPVSTLWSVAGRVRGELLRWGAVRVLPILALAAVVGLLVGPDTGRIGPRGSAAAIIGVLVLTVLLAPLRAIGEELVFRGIGQQAIGTWLRSPVWAIVVPVPLSLIGRGYDADPGALGTAALISLCSGVLAWKSGGLELPILLQLGTFGFAALLAPFGGPLFPGAGASVLPWGLGVLVVTVLLVLAVGSRFALPLGRGLCRSEQEPAPERMRI
ncbi:CPBP family intramembrane glutamic endopeptidase [Brachybacterium endophyticum]|uniref:CPBP family intramembrane glutamic endopeptidase n=1 Tax=Brachybacterium endophyticum TaxID=2182385 RepID=UPI0014037B5B|nr:CPBP family intramembrane glutamic endopeptidase [Brachybacterium endophyticum]